MSRTGIPSRAGESRTAWKPAWNQAVEALNHELCATPQTQLLASIRRGTTALDMSTNTTGLTATVSTPITALRAATGLAHRAGITIIAFIVAVLALGTIRAHGQASITSPSTSEALPLPTFTLRWNNVGQVETFLYLGASQGQNTYYGGTMSNYSGVNFTWPNAPASVWVRLWSKMPVYSGTAGSTVAYYQWQARDYFFYLGKLPSDRLVDAWLARFQADNGKWGGQCKPYLQDSFASVVAQIGLKTPDGSVPVMPVTTGGYYWANDAKSGFTEVLRVNPNDSNRLEAIKAMLRQVKKGDVIQYGTTASLEVGLHSLAITANYDASDTIHWADSNWIPNTVNAYQSRSVKDLASIIWDSVAIGKPAVMYPKGATLYRVRRDLK